MRDAEIKVCENDFPSLRSPESHGSTPGGSLASSGRVSLTGFFSGSPVVVCGIGLALTHLIVSPRWIVTSSGSKRSWDVIFTVTAVTGEANGLAASCAVVVEVRVLIVGRTRPRAAPHLAAAPRGAPSSMHLPRWSGCKRPYKIGSDARSAIRKTRSMPKRWSV